MGMLEPRIQRHFFDSADLNNQSAELLSKPIADAAQALLGCITTGGKVLACGNGSAACSAQHMVTQLVGRFERERPGLAAIGLVGDGAVLTALGHADGFAAVFAKQVQVLGNPGDVLVVFSSQGQAANVIAAVDAAHDKDMTVIAFTGHGGGQVGSRLTETDVHLCVPHDRDARIHEVHLLAIHCLCDAIDTQLLGEQDPV
jgi:D-sedoheptulose 7-phosphate isomerase